MAMPPADVYPGPLADAAGTPVEPAGPVPGGNGANAKTNPGRSIRFPIQLRVNLSPGMAASLKRVAEYQLDAEGVIARRAIHMFLMNTDPQYRQDIGGR